MATSTNKPPSISIISEMHFYRCKAQMLWTNYFVCARFPSPWASNVQPVAFAQAVTWFAFHLDVKAISASSNRILFALREVSVVCNLWKFSKMYACRKCVKSVSKWQLPRVRYPFYLLWSWFRSNVFALHITLANGVRGRTTRVSI